MGPETWCKRRSIQHALRHDGRGLCGTKPSDIDLVLECTWSEYQDEIESLMAVYHGWLPPDRKSDPRAGSYPCCPKHATRACLSVLDICPQCDYAFAPLAALGDARKLIRHRLLVELHRLLVSAWLDEAARPLLADAMRTDISENVLDGDTMYLVALEAGGIVGAQSSRLSTDLADLTDQLIPAGKRSVKASSLSDHGGPWILNAAFDAMFDPEAIVRPSGPLSRPWPGFPADWDQMGAHMSVLYPTKFKRR